MGLVQSNQITQCCFDFFSGTWWPNHYLKYNEPLLFSWGKILVLQKHKDSKVIFNNFSNYWDKTK